MSTQNNEYYGNTGDTSVLKGGVEKTEGGGFNWGSIFNTIGSILASAANGYSDAISGMDDEDVYEYQDDESDYSLSVDNSVSYPDARGYKSRINNIVNLSNITLADEYERLQNTINEVSAMPVGDERDSRWRDVMSKLDEYKKTKSIVDRVDTFNQSDMFDNVKNEVESSVIPYINQTEDTTGVYPEVEISSSAPQGYITELRSPELFGGGSGIQVPLTGNYIPEEVRPAMVPLQKMPSLYDLHMPDEAIRNSYNYPKQQQSFRGGGGSSPQVSGGYKPQSPKGYPVPKVEYYDSITINDYDPKQAEVIDKFLSYPRPWDIVEALSNAALFLAPEIKIPISKYAGKVLGKMPPLKTTGWHTEQSILKAIQELCKENPSINPKLINQQYQILKANNIPVRKHGIEQIYERLQENKNLTLHNVIDTYKMGNVYLDKQGRPAIIRGKIKLGINKHGEIKTFFYQSRGLNPVKENWVLIRKGQNF